MNHNFEIDIIRSLLSKLKKKNCNVTFVKSNSSFEITEKEIENLISNGRVHLMYYRFEVNQLHSAYEPFMKWIRQLYELYFAKNVSIDEFVELGKVYSMHKVTFSSYIKNGRCVRREETLVAEKAYEEKKFIDSIVNMLIYISKVKQLFFILDKVHLAGNSTVRVFAQLLRSNDIDNITILAGYNENYPVADYMRLEWNDMIKKLKYRNRLIDSEAQNYDTPVEEIQNFVYEAKDIKEYICKIKNMIYMLAVEQARYYLRHIYEVISDGKFEIRKVDRIRILLMYAIADIYLGNYSHAVQLCDELARFDDDNNLITSYVCHYWSCIAHSYLNQDSAKRADINKCLQIADKVNSEYIMMKTYFLRCMVYYDNFENTSLEHDKRFVPDGFLEVLEKYGFYNSLAYIYAFVIENNYYLQERLENNESSMPYFYKAIDIAMKLKNYKFVYNVYGKRHFILSSNNVLEVCERLQNEQTEIMTASGEGINLESYMVMAYNYTRSEQYEKSFEHSNYALSKIYEEVYHNRLENSLLGTYYDSKSARTEIISMFQTDLMAENLHNMAINYLSAGEYEETIEYLHIVATLIENKGNTGLKICNISKVYMMLALCYYYVNLNHNTYIYVEKGKKYIEHVIAGGRSKQWWEDSIFLYYFLLGLIAKRKMDYTQAEINFNKADEYLKSLEGQKFMFYPMIAMEKMDMYIKLGKKDVADRIANECVNYCKKQGLNQKAEIIINRMQGINEKTTKYKFQLVGVTLQKILDMSRYERIELTLSERGNNNLFIDGWQRSANKSYKSTKDLMYRMLDEMKGYFAFDSITYIKNTKNGPEIVYSDENLNGLEDEIVATYTKEEDMFYVNRISDDFTDYDIFDRIFGKYVIAGVCVIPIVRDNITVAVMLFATKVRNNFTGEQIFMTTDKADALKKAVDIYYCAENRIYLQQKVTKGEQSRCEFITSLSDSIRLPINRIIGISQLMMRNEHNNDMKDTIDNLSFDSKKILAKVNNIADYAGIKNRCLKLFDSEYKLTELCTDIVKKFKITTDDKIEFRISVDGTMPNQLVGDIQRISEIILKLLDNSLEYTKCGYIELRIGYEKNEDTFYMIIEVEDSGEGIGEDIIKDIFDHDVSDSKLGLAICKGLLELMNGRIEVKSEKEKGTTFKITLPQNVLDDSATYSEAENNSINQKKPHGRFVLRDARILVVDDNDINIKLVKALLKPYEATVDSALSGAESVNMVKNRRYDLILLDHLMPEMDGIETIKEYLKLETFDSSVIALTANVSGGLREYYIDQGFCDYIPKPINIHQLEDTIYNVLKDKAVEVLDDSKEQQSINLHMRNIENYFIKRNVSIEIKPEFFNGDIDQYKKILQMFSKNARAREAILLKHLEAKDMKNYSIIVHALKTNAGYLGFYKLANLAEKLEEESKNDNYAYVSTDNARLIEIWNDIVSAINSFFMDNGDENTHTFTNNGIKLPDDELKNRLFKAREMIDEFEIDNAAEILRDIFEYSFESMQKRLIYDAINNLSDCNYREGLKNIEKVINM